MAESNLLKLTKCKWIEEKTQELKELSNTGYGILFSFFEPQKQVQKLLKVINFEASKLESSESNIDEWIKESKYDLENIKLLANCEFILSPEEYFIDYENNSIYFITELGLCNLKQILTKENDNISTSEIRKIATCLLKALQFAQNNKIAHKCLKPENVLINQKGDYITSDWLFNMSKSKDDLPVENSIFSAPEITEKSENSLDDLLKADIYSLGIIFLVCFGVPLTELSLLNKKNDEIHDNKVMEFIQNYVIPKLPEYSDIISRLTKREKSQRINIDEALSICTKLGLLDLDKNIEENLEIEKKQEEMPSKAADKDISLEVNIQKFKALEA